MGGGNQGDERFSARLNEADAMFTAVSDAGGVPYAPVALSVLSNDFTDPEIRPYLRERRVRLMPAVRRRIVRDRFSIALPRWVDVPDFEMSDNWMMLPAPGDGSIRAVLDWAATWAAQPFPPDRPPWRSVLLKDVTFEGVPGRLVLLSQQHHAIIDGGGSLALGEKWKELPPIIPHQPMPPLPPPVPFDTSTAFERWKEGWALEGAKAREGLRNTWTRIRWAAAHPRAGARRARELAGAVRRMTKAQGTSTRSPLLRRQSDHLRFDWLTFDLAELKAGGKAVGGTLNHAFMGAVSVGLHRYHHDHGLRVDAVRTAVPINTRTEADGYLGNRVVATMLDMPLRDDAAVAVTECGRVASSHIRDDDVLWVLDRFRALANRLPRRVVVPMTRRTMGGYDLQLSNAMGPTERGTSTTGVETLATCPLPIGPSALTITLATFAGDVSVGVCTDRVAIPDPELLVHHLEEGFKAVIALAAD
jgi:diacylglycerol O-acyltransferase